MNKKNTKLYQDYFGISLPLATNNTFFITSLVSITFLVFIFQMNFLSGLIASLISLGIIGLVPYTKKKRKRL